MNREFKFMEESIGSATLIMMAPLAFSIVPSAAFQCSVMPTFTTIESFAPFLLT
jgi:hypothetical protein